jgi:hypothetical protein
MSSWFTWKKLFWRTILALVFTSVAAISPVYAEASAGRENAASSDTAKIKATIQSYFIQRYEAQKALVKPAAGYSSLYSSMIENADPLWLQREQDRLEILLTIAETTRFNFTAYKFSLDYQGINVTGNIATVSLLESNWLSYPGSSEPSLLGNLAHTIALKKNPGGAWRITKDDYLDDTLRSMAGATKADVLKTIHNNLLAVNRMPASNDNTPTGLENSSNDSVLPGLTSYPYIPSHAVNYADAHWNRAGTVPGYVRGIPGWVAGWKTSFRLYPGVGQSGDCTNFASQAIFLGVDYTASDANYFYPNIKHINDWWYYDFSGKTDDLVGGSVPWVRVDALYNFLITNTGRGPYGVKKGSPAVSGCGLAPGDVIMMKDATKAWAHTVIVRARATTSCAYPPYAFVDAHSNNVRNAPLANYLTFTWFPVHITGYRE